MFLEDVIMKYVERIYPGYYVDASYPLKVTRDADLEYEDYDGDELIEVIENLEMRRAIGAANRFQYDTSMPKNMLRFIIENFDLSEDILVEGGHTHNFRDFFAFPNPLSPQLEIEKSTPLRIPELDQSQFLYKAIEQRDFLLHFPFQSFDYFISFLNEAAIDDEVVEIRTTQYRVASKSAVVDALINAAINGKNVTVFVELKARFDEEANLEYAHEMKKAGIKIIYSIPGLKVHSKVALIKRKNKETGIESSQAFLGTGNFNEKTAKLYCDHGFFTSDKKIVKELNQFFEYLEDQTVTCDFKELLIASFNLVDELKKLVRQEIQHVKNGNKGYILLKMNGLEDPKMIDELYKASEAGVQIDLIVRGVCKLITGKKFSENIRVVRIVDMYLEHARVFYFRNNEFIRNTKFSIIG
jgi:polyphosphate kinase